MKLNKRERKAQQLLAHYATCERLALHLGMPAAKADGKKISVALWKLEREAHRAATAQCNGADYEGQPYRSTESASKEAPELTEWEYFVDSVRGRVSQALGDVPPGFFVNSDPRGYALKIDPEQGQSLIATVKLHTDWGDNGILSPDITGD